MTGEKAVSERREFAFFFEGGNFFEWRLKLLARHSFRRKRLLFSSSAKAPKFLSAHPKLKTKKKKTVLQDAECAYLVMERLRGGDLDQALASSGPLSERAAAAVAHEVLKVVATCHAEPRLLSELLAEAGDPAIAEVVRLMALLLFDPEDVVPGDAVFGDGGASALATAGAVDLCCVLAGTCFSAAGYHGDDLRVGRPDQIVSTTGAGDHEAALSPTDPVPGIPTPAAGSAGVRANHALSEVF